MNGQRVRNSRLVASVCVAGGFAFGAWLGWRGVLAYSVGGAFFGVGTAINRVRQDLAASRELA